MYVAIDDQVVEESMFFLDAKITPKSNVCVFRKLRQQIVTVRYQNKERKYCVCEDCVLHQIITTFLVGSFRLPHS